MQILIKSFAIVFVLASAAAWSLFDESIALAVGLGFLIMGTNIVLTRHTVRQFTSGGRSTLVGLYILKMATLLGVIFLILRVLEMNVIGLIVGLSLPMLIMIFAGNRWMAIEDDSAQSDEETRTIQTGV